MDIINQGAQYKVVDTHDGRVRKIPLTAEESRAVIKGWYAPKEAPSKELAINYSELAIDSCQKIRQLLDKHPELGYSFGSPYFEGKGTYTQEKAQTLGEALNGASLPEGRKLIDKYVDLVLLHWQYGFSERVFNSTINNGIDGMGRIILLDFGEITFNRQKAIKSIASKRWLRAFSYKKDIPEQLKDYYDTALTERLSPQGLAAAWGMALEDQ